MLRTSKIRRCSFKEALAHDPRIDDQFAVNARPMFFLDGDTLWLYGPGVRWRYWDRKGGFNGNGYFADERIRTSSDPDPPVCDLTSPVSPRK